MRKLILGAFLGLLASVCHATCDPTLTPTYTPNVGLAIQPINSCGWGTYLNNNFSSIDQLEACTACNNVFSGSNNTFQGALNVNNGKAFSLYNPNSSSNATLQNNGAPGKSALEINSFNGLGINGAGLDTVGNNIPTMEVYPASFQNYGSFACIGNDGSGHATYSGFIATSPVTTSVLWSLPPADGASGQVLQTDGLTHLSWTNQTSGGSGGSILAITTGTSGGFTYNISSPTKVVIFDNNTFNGQLLSGNTYFSTLNSSSVTLQGNTFNIANKLVQLSGSGLVNNGNLDSSSVTLQGNIFPSSAVFFGSAKSAISSDSSTFVVKDNAGAFHVHFGSNPYTWPGFTDVGVQGIDVWSDNAGDVPVMNFYNPNGTGSTFFNSFIGNPTSLSNDSHFSIAHTNANLVTFANQQFATDGSYKFAGGSGHNEASFSVNGGTLPAINLTNVAGVGAKCIHTDNNGFLTATSADCGSGSGGSSSLAVFGSNGVIISSPTSGIQFSTNSFSTVLVGGSTAQVDLAKNLNNVETALSSWTFKTDVAISSNILLSHGTSGTPYVFQVPDAQSLWVGPNGSIINNFGTFGTFMGAGAGAQGAMGGFSSGFGNAALNALTSGAEDSGFGYGACANLVDGSYVICFGPNSGASVVHGSYDTFIGGVNAGYAVTGSSVITIGFGSGYGHNGTGAVTDSPGFIGIGNNTGIGASGQHTRAISLGNDAQVTCDSCAQIGGDFGHSDAMNLIVGTVTTSVLVTSGTGPGEVIMSRGAAPAALNQKDIIYGDSTDDWINYVPGNQDGNPYNILASSAVGAGIITIGHVAVFSSTNGAMIDGGVNGGQGNAILNQSTLQVGATAFPDFLLVNTSFTNYGSSTLHSTVTILGVQSSSFTGVTSMVLDQAPFIITNSSLTVGSPTSTTAGNSPYVILSASGTSQAMNININGRPSGGEQNQVGGVNIYGPNYPNDAGFSPALLVLADSTTNSTNGAGLLELWEDNPAHNSYLLWIHGSSTRNSDEPIRFDGPTFGIDEVSSSTDSAHGLGKWKVVSQAYQGIDLQLASNRAWDNTTFENELYIHPATRSDLQAPGTWLQTQSLADDSGILTTSDTLVYGWTTLNQHLVGLTGPSNPTASWNFRLPSTFNNLGQVLYQASNGDGNNLNARRWEFTSGGSSGQLLSFTGSAPSWSSVASVSASSMTISTGTLVINSSTNNGYELVSGTDTNGPNAYFHLDVSTFGHISTNGTKPTLSSCGTGPTTNTNCDDNACTITPGSTAGGCTITFAQKANNVPTCVVEEETLSLVNALSYTVTTSAITVSQTSLTSKLDYICWFKD